MFHVGEPGFVSRSLLVSTPEDSRYWLKCISPCHSDGLGYVPGSSCWPSSPLAIAGISRVYVFYLFAFSINENKILKRLKKKGSNI